MLRGSPVELGQGLSHHLELGLAEGRIKEEVQKVFSRHEGIDIRFFPENSAQVPDVPTITFAVVDPMTGVQDDPKLQQRLEAMTREHGKSARTFKSGLIWVVPDSSATMKEEARKLLAWEEIRDEGLKLDEAQDRQLKANIERARRDLKESVWRSYKLVFLLDKENRLRTVDLGLVTSSAAQTLPTYVVASLRKEGEIEKEVAARFPRTELAARVHGVEHEVGPGRLLRVAAVSPPPIPG